MWIRAVVAEAMNPDRRLLNSEEMDELRAALGRDVREIWTHI